MSLTPQEQAELENLENPQIEYLSSPVSGIWSYFFGNRKSARRERIIELRFKARIDELGLDPDIDFECFYQIRQEEEERAAKLELK